MSKRFDRSLGEFDYTDDGFCQNAVQDVECLVMLMESICPGFRPTSRRLGLNAGAAS